MKFKQSVFSRGRCFSRMKESKKNSWPECVCCHTIKINLVSLCRFPTFFFSMLLSSNSPHLCFLQSWPGLFQAPESEWRTESWMFLVGWTQPVKRGIKYLPNQGGIFVYVMYYQTSIYIPKYVQPRKQNRIMSFFSSKFQYRLSYLLPSYYELLLFISIATREILPSCYRRRPSP